MSLTDEYKEFLLDTLTSISSYVSSIEARKYLCNPTYRWKLDIEYVKNEAIKIIESKNLYLPYSFSFRRNFDLENCLCYLGVIGKLDRDLTETSLDESYIVIIKSVEQLTSIMDTINSTDDETFIEIFQRENSEKIKEVRIQKRKFIRDKKDKKMFREKFLEKERLKTLKKTGIGRIN